MHKDESGCYSLQRLEQLNHTIQKQGRVVVVPGERTRLLLRNCKQLIVHLYHSDDA